MISGNDETPIDIAAQQRQAHFNVLFTEISSIAEYYFLNFKDENAYLRWSPYLFLGVGSMIILQEIEENYVKANQRGIQFVIPFGGGFKYLFKQRFTLGLAFGLRKTFFDYLDVTSDGFQGTKDYKYGNPNDNDWYNYGEISFSYIFQTIPCIYRYDPKKYIKKK